MHFLLDLVHQLVGFPYIVFQNFAGGRIRHDIGTAGRDPVGARGCAVVFLQFAKDPVFQLCSGFFSGIRCYDEKFISAKTHTDPVGVYVVPDGIGHDTDRDISLQMAELVIDPFHIVDIDEHHRHRSFLAVTVFVDRFHLVFVNKTGVETGHRILVIDPFQILIQHIQTQIAAQL